MTDSSLDVSASLLKSGNTRELSATECSGEPNRIESFDDSLKDAIVESKTANNQSDMPNYSIIDSEQSSFNARQHLPPHRVTVDDLAGLSEVRSFLADTTNESGGLGAALTAARAVSVDLFVSSSSKADGQTGNAKLGADWAVVNKSFPIVNHQFNIFENRLLSVAPGETNIEMNSLVHAQKSAHDDDVNRSLLIREGSSYTNVHKNDENRIPARTENTLFDRATFSQSSKVISTSDFASNLRILKAKGGGEARLQLHPAELGRMTIRLSTEGDEARVTFVVENHHARQVIESNMPRLRDLMEQSGLSLADTDVAEQQLDDSDAWSSEQFADENGDELSESDSTDSSRVIKSDHLLDTFA